MAPLRVARTFPAVAVSWLAAVPLPAIAFSSLKDWNGRPAWKCSSSRHYLFWDQQWRLGDDETVLDSIASDDYTPPVLWDHTAVTKTALAKCGLSTLKHLLGCVGIPAPTPKGWVVLHHRAFRSVSLVPWAGNLRGFADGISGWLGACSILRLVHAAVTKQAPPTHSLQIPMFCMAEVDFFAQTGHSSLLCLHHVFVFGRLLLATSKSWHRSAYSFGLCIRPRVTVQTCVT